jgi:hypothetical protein
MIERGGWISRPWGSIGGTYPLLVAHSLRRRFGRSLRSCPWIRLLGLMGSLVVFIALPGWSLKGMSSALSMLSPLWTAAASTISTTHSSSSCPSHPTQCLWVITALLASSTALGKSFQKRCLTALLQCCRSWFPLTIVLLSKVVRFRIISYVSSVRQRL